MTQFGLYYLYEVVEIEGGPVPVGNDEELHPGDMVISKDNLGYVEVRDLDAGARIILQYREHALYQEDSESQERS